MKKSITLLISIIVLFISCNKNSDKTENQRILISNSVIDTTIFSIDTLYVSFGTFGNHEELEIIKEPKHAKTFQLSNEELKDRILQYIPQDNYLGIDTVSIITKRIASGSDSFVKKDSVLLVIRTVKDSFHKNLIGKWNLTYECGGFTGDCDTVDERNFGQLEFKYNMRYIRTYSDLSFTEYEYCLIDSIGKKYVRLIDFLFDLNFNRYMFLEEDYLTERRGDIRDFYLHVNE